MMTQRAWPLGSKPAGVGTAIPPLAGTPYKDPRAPQNLVPIGGLECELRHRLGDQQLLYRALRAAAMAVPAKLKTDYRRRRPNGFLRGFSRRP